MLMIHFLVLLQRHLMLGLISQIIKVRPDGCPLNFTFENNKITDILFGLRINSFIFIFFENSANIDTV